MLPGIANHLWQSTVFAAAIGLMTLLFKSNHARTRHWLWLVASLKFLVPFSLLVSIGNHIEWRSGTLPAQSPIPAVLEQIDQPFATADSDYQSPVVIHTGAIVPKLVPILWFCGSILVIASWAGRWRRTRNAMRPTNPVDLRVPIRVLSSPSLLEPGVFGVFRPVLLLPEGIADRLTPAQFTAIIAHELCHVRRRDNLAALVHMLVEAAFWFHPLVWWIGGRLIDERERACDEEVLRQGSEPQTYAESILQVCKFYLQSPIECVSGISGPDLKQRIERIMAPRVAGSLDLGRKFLLAALGAAAVATPLIIGLINASPTQAQSPVPDGRQLEFEVASVRLVNRPVPAHPYNLEINHGILTADAIPLKIIIGQAFQPVLIQKTPDGDTIIRGYPPFRIQGGPDWIDTERYDVRAKAGNPDATREEVRAMLRTLLADRFKLASHKETRQLPVYLLVMGKNRQKLKEADADEQVESSFRVESGKCHLTCRNTQIGGLINRLGGLLGKPVLDKTGLAGRYDFMLEWATDTPSGTAGAGPPQLNGAPSDPGPSLLAAVQEQLGLKLEASKGPVEIMVIDHVDHASEN